MSHDELVNALSNVPELVDVLPSLASRAALTGKLLIKKDSVEKLQTVGFEDPDVAQVFLEDYLQPWICAGVSTFLLTPTTSIEMVNINIIIE